MKVTKRLVLTSGKIFSSGLAVMALNHIYSSPELIKDLSWLGAGTLVATESAKLFISVAPNYIARWFDQAKETKNHHQNHDLEKALHAAYSIAIEQVRDELIAILNLRENAWKKSMRRLGIIEHDQDTTAEDLKDFFNEILAIFCEPENLSTFFDKELQFDIPVYLDEIFSLAKTKALIEVYITNEAIAAEAVSFFKNSFPARLSQAFIQELKHDEKAKTVYFKMLIELSLQRITEVKANTDLLVTQNSDIYNLLSDLNRIATRTGNQLDVIIANGNWENQVSATLRAMAPTVETLTLEIKKLREIAEANRCWIPNLVLPASRIALDKTNISTYNSRYTDFIGRDVEMAHLYNFWDSDEPFSWWMMAGPGGMGKSRVALEFALHIKSTGALTGFYKLDTSSLPDDHLKIGAELPLLIIVDYAMSDQTKSLQLLTFIQDKIDTALAYNEAVGKVRVLLIDREFNKGWMDMIGTVKATTYLSETSFYTPLIIQHQGEDLRWSIISQLVVKEKPNDYARHLELIRINKETVLKKLEELDPQKRPLFAFFAGEALIYEGISGLRNWNVHNLLDGHLQRLRRIWLSRGEYRSLEPAILELLVLNILARRISKQELTKQINIIASSDSLFTNKMKQTYLAIAEEVTENDKVLLAGMQPDILGEFFLIQHFSTWLDDEPEKIEKIVQQAWEISSGDTWWTLNLLYEDFLLTKTAYRALELILINGISYYTNETNAKYYAYLLNNIVANLLKSPEDERLIKYEQLYEKIYLSYPDDEEIAKYYSYRLIGQLDRNINFNEKLEIKGRLINVYSKFPRTEDIAYNLIWSYSHLSESGLDEHTAIHYLKESQKIYEEFGSELIGEVLAIFEYEISNRWRNELFIESAIIRLDRLHLQYPQNVKITRFLVYTIIKQSELSDQVISRKISNVELIFKLQDKFPQDEKIADALSAAVYNIIYYDTDLRRSLQLLQKLRKLQNNFAGEQPIANRLAYSLQLIAQNDDQLNLVFDHLEEIRLLAGLFPLSPNILESLIKCYIKLFSSTFDDVTLAHYLPKITECYNLSILDESCGYWSAMLYFDLVSDVSDANEREKLLSYLKGIYQKFPDDEFIKMKYALMLDVQACNPPAGKTEKDYRSLICNLIPKSSPDRWKYFELAHRKNEKNPKLFFFKRYHPNKFSKPLSSFK